MPIPCNRSEIPRICIYICRSSIILEILTCELCWIIICLCIVLTNVSVTNTEVWMITSM